MGTSPDVVLAVGLAVPSISLSPGDHNVLLAHYRRAADPDVRLRAHILLLLDAGHPWATISAVLFCSFSTISRWKRQFEKGGVDGICGRARGRRRSAVHIWAAVVVRWVLTPLGEHAAEFGEYDVEIVVKALPCER